MDIKDIKDINWVQSTKFNNQILGIITNDNLPTTYQKLHLFFIIDKNDDKDYLLRTFFDSTVQFYKLKTENGCKIKAKKLLLNYVTKLERKLNYFLK